MDQLTTAQPTGQTDKELDKLRRENEELKKQNLTVMDRLDKITSQLEKQDQEKLQNQLQKQRDEKLAELRKIDQRAAKRYENESNLDKLDTAIELAREFKLGFPDISGDIPPGDGEEKTRKGVVGYKKPGSDDWVSG